MLNLILTWLIGNQDKVTVLISGLAPDPEEESPYEALFEATSCHSLDSLTSGKSSDRDSGRPDSEVGKVGNILHSHTNMIDQYMQVYKGEKHQKTTRGS